MSPASQLRVQSEPTYDSAAQPGLRTQVIELLAARDILLAFTRRFLLSRHRQTVLGVVWSLTQSLSVGVLAAIVLQRFVQIEALQGESLLLVILVGIVPWTFFSRAVILGVSSVLEEQVFLGRVHFPREVLPLSRVLGCSVDLAVGLGVVLVVVVLADHPPHPAWLLLPLPLVTLLLFTVACTLGPAALNVRWRDVQQALPLLLQLGLFAVPVLFPTSVLPETVSAVWVVLCPIVGSIDGLRAILLDDAVPSMGPQLAALMWAAVLAAISHRILKAMEPTLADAL